jgi:hypothetical protein
MSESPEMPTIELGLVMAGAVSAGAYTAGVADFLIEALDAWEQARSAGDPGAPAHRVRVTAISGASAGAMTAAIVAGIAAGRPHQPATMGDPGPVAKDNALFDSWVNRIDADGLLATGDLVHDDRRLLSLLNGSALEEIARDAVPEGAGGSCRAWIGESLHLAFAITNLRGVPYNVGFGDHSQSPEPRPGHSMRKHADLLRFRIGQRPAERSATDVIDLDPPMCGDGWKRLRSAALASGAFPLMLPPRALHRPASDYATRRWAIPTHGPAGDIARNGSTRYEPLPPHWGDTGTPRRFEFLAVDGGILDNEPFAAARELLVGSPPAAPAGAVTGRVLISIDPFPDVVAYRPDEPQPAGLLDVALALLGAMKNQNRFQPDELVTAFDDPHARRHLVAPSRRIDGERMDHPLAGGAVSGFAGFIDRSFRLHDFQLGRANCQRFLARHFRLPAAHPLFAGWHAQWRADFADGTDTLPAIPLLGPAAIPIATPPWPVLPAARLDVLRLQLVRRVRAILPRAIDHLLARNGPAMRWVTRRLAHFQSRAWVLSLIAHIRRELRERGQL